MTETKLATLLLYVAQLEAALERASKECGFNSDEYLKESEIRKDAIFAVLQQFAQDRDRMKAELEKLRNERRTH